MKANRLEEKFVYRNVTVFVFMMKSSGLILLLFVRMIIVIIVCASLMYIYKQ